MGSVGSGLSTPWGGLRFLRGGSVGGMVVGEPDVIGRSRLRVGNGRGALIEVVDGFALWMTLVELGDERRGRGVVWCVSPRNDVGACRVFPWTLDGEELSPGIPNAQPRSTPLV